MLFLKNFKRIFFPFYKKKIIKDLFQILNENKTKNAMFVGGCVRKHLNSEEVGDIDIATCLTPEEVISKFNGNKNFKIHKTGIDHGTLTIVSNLDGSSFEITTLREDVSTDGRHAKVAFSKDWTKDSERRDFTINAIYMDERGKIFDPQNGLKDLKEKKIKFIGNAHERIQEDYLRILRYLRFSLMYQDLDVDEETSKAIEINVSGINKLAKERIYIELRKIIDLNNLDIIFKNRFLLNLTKVLFPELRYFERVKNLMSFKKLLGQYTVDFVFSLLLIDKTNNHQYFIHKYKVPNLMKETLNFYHENLKEIEGNKNFFKKDLRRNIFYIGKYLNRREQDDYFKKNNHYFYTSKMKELAVFYYMTISKPKLSDLKSLISKINSVKLPKYPVSGDDLLKKGMKSGKRIGLAIKAVEKKWVDNNFDIKNEDLDSLLKKYI